ncbi:hypothetical protein Tco_0214159 [Tanacetum coccineum]
MSTRDQFRFESGFLALSLLTALDIKQTGDEAAISGNGDGVEIRITRIVRLLDSGVSGEARETLFVALGGRGSNTKPRFHNYRSSS